MKCLCIICSVYFCEPGGAIANSAGIPRPRHQGPQGNDATTQLSQFWTCCCSHPPNAGLNTPSYLKASLFLHIYFHFHCLSLSPLPPLSSPSHALHSIFSYLKTLLFLRTQAKLVARLWKAVGEEKEAAAIAEEETEEEAAEAKDGSVTEGNIDMGWKTPFVSVHDVPFLTV